jgi:crossover junction endodeoxyribonuclease RuvC
MGVDPGMYGGVAFLYSEWLDVFDIPLVGPDVDVDELVRLIRQYGPRLAMVERSGSMPKQGVASTFRYGMAVGCLRGAIIACGVPLHLVAATKWKAHFRIGREKELARGLAIRFWPGTGFFARKKDHGRAEAALIARYAQDTEQHRGVESGNSEESRAGEPSGNADANAGRPTADSA